MGGERPEKKEPVPPHQRPERGGGLEVARKWGVPVQGPALRVLRGEWAGVWKKYRIFSGGGLCREPPNLAGPHPFLNPHPKG